ncbi:hypothetical protein JCM16138_13350 [Thermococcus atlanticus]
MKKIGVLLALLFALSFVSYAVAETQIDTSKIHFYMYGASSCPHCRRMKAEIPEVFGKDSLTYYELVGNEENSKLFNELYQLTGISGVPAIGIAYKGKLYAVIEGEFNVSATPLIIQDAQKNGGLILVVGGKAYLIKNQTHIQKLQTLFIEHKSVFESPGTNTNSNSSAPQSSTATGSTTSSGGKTCGPALILLLAPLPLLLRKRR